jgi:hypothetical protein
MRDKKLMILLALIIILSLGHDADHFVRGDFRRQLSGGSVPIIIAIVTSYVVLGLGLFFYFKNRFGVVAILAGIGVALGWLVHFSPFSDQTPQFIYRAYEAPAAGALAVALLSGLMLALIITALYAEYLWARSLK